MKRRAAAAAAVAVVALAVVAAVIALAGSSGEGAESAGAATAAGGTAPVARRTLAERVTVEGTIGYAGETTVLARLSGTVTALPAVGDVVKRGERLYSVAGEPVLLMYGSVPAYRTLVEGISEGPDVEQLERNLAALGYEPGTVDEEFTSSTAAAVSAWQEDLGLEASAEVELGRVAFLRGPQRVTDLEAQLGEALGGGAAGGSKVVDWVPAAEGGVSRVEGAKEAAPEAAPAAPEAESPPAEEREPKEPGKPEKPEEPEQPAGDLNPPTRGPAEPEPEERVEAQPEISTGEPSISEGGFAEPEAERESEPASTPVLSTSSTKRVVTVSLDPDQQSIAHRGQGVEVVLPGGAEVAGKVRELTAVESSGEGRPGEEAEAAVEATVSVTGKRRIPALDGAAVSVVFTQRVRKQVLSVPLTALVAIGGERFAVYVVEGAGRRRIVVTPGLAADGFVEVEGKGLRAGIRVETGG